MVWMTTKKTTFLSLGLDKISPLITKRLLFLFFLLFLVESALDLLWCFLGLLV